MNPVLFFDTIALACEGRSGRNPGGLLIALFRLVIL